MQHDLQRDNSGAFASMIAATTFVVLLISACVAQQCVPNAAADRSVLTSQSTQPPMSRPLAVEVEAQVFDCPPTIVLRWRPLTANPTTGSVQLWRRLPNDLRVAAPIVVLPANATNYVDTNVTIGVAYEYIVMVAPQSTPILNGGLGVPQGYIRSGIQIPVVRKRGAVLIVIERQLQTALAAIPRARGNIDLLRSDLTAEGWTSTVIAVNANDTVVTVKAAITAAYRADANLKALYLIGQVPYAYSGNQNPDGHGDHLGAWPCDGFYGDIDYPASMWTDVKNLSALSVATRLRNWPGDGKYDDLYFESPLELQVGRVDLSRMTVFPAPFQSEANLTARYLLKSHEFRTAQRTYKRHSLLRVHFDNYLSGKGPVRFLRPFFGDFPVLGADQLLQKLQNESSLISAGDGPGSNSAAVGIGSAITLATLNPRVAVLPLLGSYFGDPDTTNNFLRAAIATEHVLLTWWHAWPGFQSVHQMALGVTAGEMANASLSRYTANSAQQTFPEGGRSGSPAVGRVYVSLLGDPTLRLFNVPQPTVVADASSCGTVKFTLTETKPSGDDTDAPPTRHFEILDSNWNFISNVNAVNGAATYSHSMRAGGAVSLLVRAVRLETTKSGTFFTPSLAVTATGTATACASTPTTATTKATSVPTTTTTTVTAAQATTAATKATTSTTSTSKAIAATTATSNAATTTSKASSATTTLIGGSGTAAPDGSPTVSASAETGSSMTDSSATGSDGSLTDSGTAGSDGSVTGGETSSPDGSAIDSNNVAASQMESVVDGGERSFTLDLSVLVVAALMALVGNGKDKA
jgi:hypothetical protein